MRFAIGIVAAGGTEGGNLVDMEEELQDLAGLWVGREGAGTVIEE